jgi:hypothetical protein
VIARRANKVYDCDLVQYQYEDYFQDVLNLWDPRGWSLMDGGAGHTLDQRDFYDFYPTSLQMNESCEAIGPIKKGTNASYGKADGRSSNSSLPLSSFQRSMR